jgi:hypothetical protein
MMMFESLINPRKCSFAPIERLVRHRLAYPEPRQRPCKIFDTLLTL